jgi:CrcB protein
MKDFILVFLGSGLGGCLRYGISQMHRTHASGSAFPWSTLLSNLLACLLAGYLIGKFLPSSGAQEVHLRLLLLIGFCGGFSTFSAWSVETVQLFRNGMAWLACLYMILSMAAGFVSVWIFTRNA